MVSGFGRDREHVKKKNNSFDVNEFVISKAGADNIKIHGGGCEIPPRHTKFGVRSRLFMSWVT